MRSVYHVRNLDVFRLKQMESNPPDIMLSHDWPNGITDHGNVRQLLSKKQFFAEDIANKALGSGPAMEVLQALKPAYWFAGHLHVKFAALVNHQKDQKDKEERQTKFLALDKCLPNRRFLQILTAGPEVGPEEEVVLAHDPKWLAILKATNHLQSVSSKMNHMPFHSDDYAGAKHVDDIAAMDLTIRPEAFKATAPAFDPQSPEGREARVQVALNKVSDPGRLANPQTQFLCKALEIDDPLDKLEKEGCKSSAEKPVKKQQDDLSTSGSAARLDLSSFLPTPANLTLVEDSEEPEEGKDAKICNSNNERSPNLGTAF